MEIIIIVAMGNNREIGVNANLPWNLPRDMKHFRDCTINNAVVMGRKTMESIPKLPLKDRLNIVISRSISFSNTDLIVCQDIKQAINIAKDRNYKKLFVIGGEAIYREFLPICDRIIMTKVKASFKDANVFFPSIDFSEWKEVSKEIFEKDEKNKFDLEFIEYVRLK